MLAGRYSVTASRRGPATSSNLGGISPAALDAVRRPPWRPRPTWVTPRGTAPPPRSPRSPRKRLHGGRLSRCARSRNRRLVASPLPPVDLRRFRPNVAAPHVPDRRVGLLGLLLLQSGQAAHHAKRRFLARRILRARSGLRTLGRRPPTRAHRRASRCATSCQGRSRKVRDSRAHRSGP